MSEHPEETWPDEPDQADLLAFGAQLRQSRPRLSGEALSRVEARLRQARAAEQFVNRRRMWLGMSLAAAVMLATAVCFLLQPAPPAAPPHLAVAQPPARISDRFTVNLPTPAGLAPARPLLRTESYRSLYEEL